MGNFTSFTILNGGGGGGGVGKVYAMEVKMEVAWVDGLFARILVLLTGQCTAEKPVVLLYRHSEEAQLVGYIQGLFSLYP